LSSAVTCLFRFPFLKKLQATELDDECEKKPIIVRIIIGADILLQPSAL
jgi:hypothetical protein